MGAGNIEDFYPLSPAQQGMLFHTVHAPDSGVYFEQLSCTLQGELDVPAFQQAWQQVTDRHPILRTSFIWEDVREPVQVVSRQVTLPVERLDWQEFSPAEQQQQLETFLQAERQRGFQLNRAPLMRLTLIQLASDSCEFIWSHHHLLLDGWSTPLLLEEVFEIYRASLKGEKLSLPRPRPYRDYIVWIQQQNLSAAESFWRGRLGGFAAPTRLPVERDLSQKADREERYEEREIRVGAATTAALQTLARQHQLTLNTLVQGAWGLLLSRYTGEGDIVFGAAVSGRPPALAGAESMVGLFINTLPVRVRVRPEDSLLSWLKQLQADGAEARQYEYSPLVEVRGWSDVPRSLPLFESLVVFENYPLESCLQEGLENLQVRNVRSFEKTNYPLTLTAVPGSELALTIACDSNRFDAGTIARMLGHLQTLLEGMAASPKAQLSELSLLSYSEKQQLLVEWNGTQADFPQDACIGQLFEAQVERTPDAVAAVFENEQLTYRQLNSRANQLAHYLQSLGVRPGVLVGISVRRSLEMLVGLLGILKAGGAYVPLDPAYPKERLAFMLADAQVPVLLTQEKLLESLPENSAEVVCADTGWDIIARESDRNPAVEMGADSVAYALYTSGSAGTPKGVLGTHRGAVNRCYWNPYPFTPEDICCQKTSLNFVDSVWEIFAPLLRGLQTVIIADEAVKDPHRLVQTLCERNVTRLVLVPSLLRALLETFPDLDRRLPKLKYWISSGETLPAQLCQQFRERMPSAILLNLYGSSEVAADVTWHDTSKGEAAQRVPIGRPIANTQIYILDPNLQPVPIGVPGEICVSGAAVARGYLNRPELTAEKFIANPFADSRGAGEMSIPHAQCPMPNAQSKIQNPKSSRLYRTGDLGCYLPDGNIEFLGRIDGQVKIRGFRIELGEIEAALCGHPEVRQAAVTVREDEFGGERLVAYIVPNQQLLNPQPTHAEFQALSSQMRQFVREKLPYYMVPNVFVLLDELPLTPNGKIDRRALVAPDFRLLGETAVAGAQTETERELAEIWSAVLGVERVGSGDNFFELGGHSLMAAQLVSRLRAHFGVELPVSDLFASPTLRDLAETVEEAILVSASSAKLDELLDRIEEG